MIQIDMTQTTLDNSYSAILKLFESNLTKKEDKKIKWSISLAQFNGLIKRKLSHFDSNISFEKLVKAEYDYLKALTDYIDTHKQRVQLSKNEKDYFLTLYSRFNKPAFIQKLNTTVCPYCNRNYIFNFNTSNKQNATAQLDHFFDKSTYSYLAISLYNLVPSCATCNQRKSSKKLEILYPYLESFDKKAKFTLKINKSTFYHSQEGFSLAIESSDKQTQKSIEVFNLEPLYQNHKDIALELIQKEAIYSESYIDELLNQYEGTLFKNREDVLRLVSGGYISNDEIHKRPLSKLIKDISQELQLI